MLQLYWEDIDCGETVPFGTATMTRDEIVAFATEFDPQPFHLDDEAARDTILKGQSASGWHTCAIVHRLMADALAERALPLQLSGAEDIRWRKPVRPGDTLSGRLVISAKSACACDERSGACHAIVDVTNQSSDVVATWRTDCIVPRRNPSSGYGACAGRPCGGRIARASRVRADHGIKFFDDVGIGDDIDLGCYAFTEERVGAFLERYGSVGQFPSHDHGFASDQRIGQWHIVSAWMHCIVRYYRQHAERLRRRCESVPLLGPAAGVKHLRWHAPVRVGELISFSTWAERKIEISTRDSWGLLVAGAEGVNAAGTKVVSFYPQMLLQKSPERRVEG